MYYNIIYYTIYIITVLFFWGSTHLSDTGSLKPLKRCPAGMNVCTMSECVYCSMTFRGHIYFACEY